MRRILLIVGVLLVAGAVLWMIRPTQIVIWDGSFDLTVHVSSVAGAPRYVACEAFSRREYAEEALEHLLPPQSRRWSATADPFDGKPILVQVAVSGRDSVGGQELKRFQFRDLVVIAVLPDGRRVGKLVEIPDCRVSREVTVTLP